MYKLDCKQTLARRASFAPLSLSPLSPVHLGGGAATRSLGEPCHPAEVSGSFRPSSSPRPDACVIRQVIIEHSGQLNMSAYLTCPAMCCVGLENCCLDNLDGTTTADGIRHTSVLGLFLEIFILLYAFTAVAIVADDHLVCSLETLCVRNGVREDVAGASFMAFGSAAPEIIINAVSTIKAVAGGGGDAPPPVAPGIPPGCACDDSCKGEDEALGIGAILGSGMIGARVTLPSCRVPHTTRRHPHTTPHAPHTTRAHDACPRNHAATHTHAHAHAHAHSRTRACTRARPRARMHLSSPCCGDALTPRHHRVACAVPQRSHSSPAAAASPPRSPPALHPSSSSAAH